MMRTDANHQQKIEKFVKMLAADPGYCVLTGAGCSTASGLPAYRDTRGDWQHDKPMQHQAFVDSEFKRKLYWSRSQQGWPNFSKARPNQTHYSLVELEQSGHIRQIVTQNVDRLHQRAGSRQVIDLHGRLDRVVCLNCGQYLSRSIFQQQLNAVNANLGPINGQIRPDGDVDLKTVVLDNYVIPNCEHCHGVLKPDVVFFGGLLNSEISNAAVNAVDSAPGLLVVGSSLMVFSGFRLVKRAVEQGKPVIIINQGTTRADDLYSLKIEHESGQVLSHACRTLA